MKAYIKIAILVIVLVFLGFFIRATDWAAELSSIQKVGYNFLILLFTTFMAAWLGALGWRYCLPRGSTRVSGWQLFWIRLIGENIAILNPTSIIGGEATKIYMMTDLGINNRAALHSIILSRAITIITQILLLAIAGIWFLSLTVQNLSWPGFEGWHMLVGLILVAGAVAFLRSGFLRRKARAFFQYIRLLDKYRNARLYLVGLSQELRVFYRENQRAMFLSILFCTLHWIVGSLEFYFILLFLGVKTTVAKALLVDMGVIVFKAAGSFIPGQVGVEEYGNKVMLGIIGVGGGAIWITASILRRARQLCWIILSLLVYFLSFHNKPAFSSTSQE